MTYMFINNLPIINILRDRQHNRYILYLLKIKVRVHKFKL